MDAEIKVKNRVNEIINILANQVIVVDEYMATKKEYNKLIETIFQYLRDGFEFKELREAPVYYRFHADTDVRTMQLRHFLTNIIFWSPLIALDAVDNLDESYLIDTKRISSKYIKMYIDEKIIHPFKRRISNKKLNIIIHDLIYNLSRISNDFNLIMGMTMNIETFIDVANKNPRFDEIIHTKLDETLQPNVVEAQIDELMNEEMEILKTEDNALRPFLMSNTGIKPKQLTEMTVIGGYKPDISGITVPVPINSNLLVGGLANTTNYYIDAIGGRKALVMSKLMMGKSGFFTRKAMLVTTGMKLRNTPGPCNSVNPISYEIKTKEHFRRLTGRMYRTPQMREFQVLRGDETELIGTTIFVRSPLTCTSYSAGHGVCEHCYGPALYHTNRGIDIGSYASIISTNPVGQNILSTKHLLTTDSIKIEFSNENFDTYCKLVSNEIMVNTSNPDISDYSIIIIKDNIITLDELNEGAYNKYVHIFHIRNDITGEMHEFIDESGTELYLSPELQNMMGITKGKRQTGNYYELNLGKIPEDTSLFIIPIVNNELTKPLREIMNVLDSDAKRKKIGINDNDISKIAQKLLDLYITSNIGVMPIHTEVIATPLIRSKSDILKRPNFARYSALEDTHILTISSALEKHPSPIVSMSFAYLKRQLKSPLTFRKSGDSFLDPFFKTKIQ